MRLALLANPDNIHVQRWAKFLVNQGHEILLIADPHTKTRLPGLETRLPRWNFLTNVLAFRLTPEPHGNSLWKALHYRPILRRFRPDLVHGFEAYYNGPATAWAGPYPKVLTPWGRDIHHDAPAGGLGRWMVLRGLRAADRITTNDETLAEYLALNFGIAPEKVDAFSWGVDLEVFHPDRRDGAEWWRERLGIGPDSPVVFSPRRFHRDWGGETFVEALPAMIRGPRPPVCVILAPDDDEGFRAAMKRRVRELKVEPSVRWIEEWVSPERMADLFSLAEVFVSAPRTDLLAMTVLEGMACGCLPVVADLPSYAKHIRDGRNAIVIRENNPSALAEGVERALADAELRRAAGQINADRMAREEDASVNMRRIEQVYADAIDSYQSRGR